MTIRVNEPGFYDKVNAMFIPDPTDAVPRGSLIVGTGPTAFDLIRSKYVLVGVSPSGVKVCQQQFGPPGFTIERLNDGQTRIKFAIPFQIQCEVAPLEVLLAYDNVVRDRFPVNLPGLSAFEIHDCVLIEVFATTKQKVSVNRE